MAEEGMMVLSETEAEARLRALRDQRDSLDRAIADLTLYLELGRRLTGAVAASPGLGRDPLQAPFQEPFQAPLRDPSGTGEGAASARVRVQAGAAASAAPPPAPVQAAPFPGWTAAEPSGARAWTGSGGRFGGADPTAFRAPSADSPAPPSPGAAAQAAPAVGGAVGDRAGGASEAGLSEGGLSEGVLARRYGRALIAAAVAVLEAAGRPLHASEILEALTAQGFALPGHDPVAALNTRLWKRSGPGGPVLRLGDAVYAPAPR